MKKSLFAVCISLSIFLAGRYSLSTVSTPSTQPVRAAEFLRVNVPAVTHGFTKTSALPDGDLFLLPRPFSMAVTEVTEGAKVFPLGYETFGGEAENVGSLPTTQPQGFSFSARNSKVKITSCDESIWDSNFIIASTQGTDGDLIRLFLDNPDGTKGPELALFTVARGGVVLSEIHPHLMLFVNDRYARGAAWHKGDHIAFGSDAGISGMRTGLLTLAWPMGFFSDLQGCYRVSVEISRKEAEGTTSIVFTDIVVNRNPIQGDNQNAGFGLLGRLTGGYPTGFPCKGTCPFPDFIPEPPIPDPLNGLTGETCQTICFRSPQYYLLNLRRVPNGTVTIGRAGYTINTSTTDRNTMLLTLRGGATPAQQLNKEYLTAQLNTLLSGGAPNLKVVYAMKSILKCYGMKFDPVTLSNGVVISTDSRLEVLFVQARLSFKENRTQDMPVLTRLFDQLNGNEPSQLCNNLWVD